MAVGALRCPRNMDKPAPAPLQAIDVLVMLKLADLWQRGVLIPDEAFMCRYRIPGHGVVVDVLSPEGFNVGGVNPWFARTVERAAQDPIGEGRPVRAVTPPCFLATKLVAFASRGPDAQSSKDAEDIVALAVEPATLLDDVRTEAMIDDVARLWLDGA